MRFKSAMKEIALASVDTISTARAFRLKLFPLLTGVVMFLVPGQYLSVVAQQNPEAGETSTSRMAALKVLSEDTRYRIGPGDVISIQVRKAPELSGAVRVDQRGMIRIHMIEGDVPAACRTESELAMQITKLYLEYKTNPNVEVFVTDFQSRPVAVIGAVEKPGQFRLQRQVRLLEVLSYAGGPTVKAGRVIDVIHTGGPDLCEKDTSGGDDVASLKALGVFKLDETLKGKEGSNPFVRPGDIVSLPEADQVFVIGHVVDPRAIPLKDKAITVSKAIAMAGGASRDGKTSKVRVIRETASGIKSEIFVDLGAIQKQKAPDITLLPNDIVEVGASTGKTLLGILTGAVPAAISNGVIRVIP